MRMLGSGSLLTSDTQKTSQPLPFLVRMPSHAKESKEPSALRPPSLMLMPYRDCFACVVIALCFGHGDAFDISFQMG